MPDAYPVFTVCAEASAGGGGDIAEQVASYRAKVRAKVRNSYDGNRHLGILLSSSLIGVVVPLWCMHEPLDTAQLTWHAIVVSLTLLYGNLAEYVAHRYGGHAS